jgi:AcrR family transcriptional regulator
MTKKPAVSPRKSPKQERSRSLVDSAVEAATRILTRLGYDGATTNKVAETAGISIGSLYQYFPNKDALIGAVIDRQLDKYMKEIEKDFERFPDLTPEEGIEKIIRHMVSVYLGNRKLFAVLFDHTPRVQRTKNILHSRRRGAELVQAALGRHLHRMPPRDLKRASYVIVNAVMGVLLIASLDDELPYEEKALADELIDMVMGHLLFTRESGQVAP